MTWTRAIEPSLVALQTTLFAVLQIYRASEPLRKAAFPVGIQFAAILAAILTDGLDAVEAACVEALTAGPCSRDVVLTILARRRTPPPVQPATVPAALTLTIVPAANCNRYDALLSRTREAANGTA